MEYAWEWKNEFGNIILDQLKKIGCSCDWNRTTFTLDDKMNKSVLKVFIDLYNKGLIYRGYRMVNWDPEAKTTLSDEEVNFVEKNDNLYYVKYKIIDSDNYVTIATTRPETILGDSAICVNPKDKRYKEFIGRSAIVPIVNRHIPIIADEYVDIEYGTGCLKVTPSFAVDGRGFIIGTRRCNTVLHCHLWRSLWCGRGRGLDFGLSLSLNTGLCGSGLGADIVEGDLGRESRIRGLRQPCTPKPDQQPDAEQRQKHQ